MNPIRAPGVLANLAEPYEISTPSLFVVLLPRESEDLRFQLSLLGRGTSLFANNCQYFAPPDCFGSGSS